MRALLVRRFTVAAIIGLVAASCGGGGSENEDPATDPTEEDAGSVSSGGDPEGPTPPSTMAPIGPGPKAPLTGLSAEEDLTELPVVVVKVSNNDDRSLEALIGIDHADVVIEERIEDRATRFAALFQSDLPSDVGPVRSGRSSDLDLLANLGTPILVFSGANIGVLGQLRELAAEGKVVLVVNDVSDIYLVRSPDYEAPENLFTDPAFVREDFGSQAGAVTPVLNFRDSDSTDRPVGLDGAGVTVIGRDTVSFVHDPARGYVRVQDGAIHETRTGAELVVTNLVVMETEYLPSEIAAGSVDAVTIGEGLASVLIGGRRWSGTWSRESRETGYRFHTNSGEEILLEPGKTWLTLVPAGTYDFVIDEETTSLVLGGER